jgi:hypothetical protein
MAGRSGGGSEMIRFLMLSLLAAIATMALPAIAPAQSSKPVPWVIKPDIAFGYDSHFKTWQYKMGTNNAGELFRGAKKVPKNTLFFLGANGQLYMRTGPFLDGDGSFKFGPS